MLKEVNASAMAVCESTEQVAQILDYTLTRLPKRKDGDRFVPSSSAWALGSRIRERVCVCVASRIKCSRTRRGMRIRAHISADIHPNASSKILTSAPLALRNRHAVAERVALRRSASARLLGSTVRSRCAASSCSSARADDAGVARRSRRRLTRRATARRDGRGAQSDEHGERARPPEYATARARRRRAARRCRAPASRRRPAAPPTSTAAAAKWVEHVERERERERERMAATLRAATPYATPRSEFPRSRQLQLRWTRAAMAQTAALARRHRRRPPRRRRFARPHGARQHVCLSPAAAASSDSVTAL